MSFLSDLKVLYHLVAQPIRGESHAERLDSFYEGQAKQYDAFRKRLLRGREALYRRLPAHRGMTWVEMGGGTGANLEFLGARRERLGKVIVVDLSSALLKVAKQRIEKEGWSNTTAVCADATSWALPPGEEADVITFSYSLTMIPDWFAAIDQAMKNLKPGGLIGVVDFYVSRKYPAPDRMRHPWLTRTFWPAWFGNDNVHPNADHLPYLERRFKTISVKEHRARVPYLPFGRVPYYQFIGRKKREEG